MFVDEARITAKAGDGGNGCFSFRREKYVPKGGPDGGDGGKGGSVILAASRDVSTLLEFRFRPLLRAKRGRHGEGSNKTGRCGEDLIVRVPVGTVVTDSDGLRRLADLAAEGDRFVAAAGGDGGRGNARFVSSVNRVPTRCEPGYPGIESDLRLELKLLADVGLLGFPNAGKSTFISRISAARPKIADYPFTTLEPQLGVVDLGDYRGFVVADIPGLIEGAHEGAGLGHRFLRHVERCRLLLHLVDPTDPQRNPVAGVDALKRELRMFQPEMADKPQILVITKSDASQDDAVESALRELAKKAGQPCFSISSVTGEGIKELLEATATRLDSVGNESDDEWQ